MAQDFSQNVGQIGNLSDFFLYGYQLMQSGETIFKQLRDPKTNVYAEALKLGYTLFMQTVGKDPEKLMDAVTMLAPQPYRPVVKGVIKNLSKEPWDVTMGVVSEFAQMAKEMGKDEKTGQYKPTEEVVKELMGALKKSVGKVAAKEIMARIGGGI